MHKFFVAAGLVIATVCGSADQGKQSIVPGESHNKHAAHLMKCAEECNICQRACDSCAAHCAHLLTHGKKEHHMTLQTCLDCATHCSAAATIMARQGPFSDLICKACIDACARCGKECERHPNDQQMKQCAEACRRCEKACRDMLAHMNGVNVEPRK